MSCISLKVAVRHWSCVKGHLITSGDISKKIVPKLCRKIYILNKLKNAKGSYPTSALSKYITCSLSHSDETVPLKKRSLCMKSVNAIFLFFLARVVIKSFRWYGWIAYQEKKV
jgi:hypothetical protein